MASSRNFNHEHVASGYFISGTDHPITVGDLRDAIASFPDDTEIAWGICSCGQSLKFYRFKTRGEKVLGIELTGD